MTSKEQLDQLIEDCENRQRLMSDWEAKFIDSIAKQLEDRGALTAKQEDILNRIWERVTEEG